MKIDPLIPLDDYFNSNNYLEESERDDWWADKHRGQDRLSQINFHIKESIHQDIYERMYWFLKEKGCYKKRISKKSSFWFTKDHVPLGSSVENAYGALCKSEGILIIER